MRILPPLSLSKWDYAGGPSAFPHWHGPSQRVTDWGSYSIFPRNGYTLISSRQRRSLANRVSTFWVGGSHLSSPPFLGQLHAMNTSSYNLGPAPSADKNRIEAQSTLFSKTVSDRVLLLFVRGPRCNSQEALISASLVTTVLAQLYETSQAYNNLTNNS